MSNKPYFLNACREGNEKKALLHMNRHMKKCMPEYIDNIGNTALMWTCIKKLDRVAIKMIKIYKRKNKPWKKNFNKYTALMLACRFKRFGVAYMLIEAFGMNCKPNNVAIDRNTALIWACKNKMEEIANHMMIIFRDNCNPGIIGKSGNTALIWACKYKLTFTALLIINMCRECKYDYINRHGMTAIYWAYINSMTEVVSLLNNMYILDEDFSKNIYTLDYRILESYELSTDSTIRSDLHRITIPATRINNTRNINVTHDTIGEDDIVGTESPLQTSLLQTHEEIRQPNIIITDKLNQASHDDVNTETSNNISYKRSTVLKCFICFNIMKNPVILKPCNHIGICEGCAALLGVADKKCPICRTLIGSIEKIFIA